MDEEGVVNLGDEVVSVRDITTREKFVIIQEVRERPLLWDIRDKGHLSYDPNEIKNEWLAVKSAVSAQTRPISLNVIQAAWKNLKDTHIKVRQKMDRKRSDSNFNGIDVAAKWKFWEAMEFMLNIHVMPRHRNKLKQSVIKTDITWLNTISPFRLNNNDPSSSHHDMGFDEMDQESTSNLVLAAAQNACNSMAHGSMDAGEKVMEHSRLPLKWEATEESNPYAISSSIETREGNQVFYSNTSISKPWNDHERHRPDVSTTTHEQGKIEESTTNALSQSVIDMYRTLKGKFPRQAAEFRKKINDLIYEYDCFLADNLTNE